MSSQVFSIFSRSHLVLSAKLQTPVFPPFSSSKSQPKKNKKNQSDLPLQIRNDCIFFRDDVALQREVVPSLISPKRTTEAFGSTSSPSSSCHASKLLVASRHSSSVTFDLAALGSRTNNPAKGLDNKI
jgi:hypothetical protein